MKPLLFFLTLFLPFHLKGGEITSYIGPHFNYSVVQFEQPQKLYGYLGGLQAGLGYQNCYFQTGVAFEGSWDALYFRGDPAQVSSLSEYFVVGRVGPRSLNWCCLEMNPYVGFGWHRFRNLELPDTINLCYRYDKLYVPVGIELAYPIFCHVRSSLLVEWRPDVYSTLHVDSMQVDNRLCHGFRVEMPFEMSGFQPSCSSCCYSLSLAPFFDWAGFGASEDEDPNGVPIDIPETTRWSLGLRFLMNYDF